MLVFTYAGFVSTFCVLLCLKGFNVQIKISYNLNNRRRNLKWVNIYVDITYVLILKWNQIDLMEKNHLLWIFEIYIKRSFISYKLYCTNDSASLYHIQWLSHVQKQHKTHLCTRLYTVVINQNNLKEVT